MGRSPAALSELLRRAEARIIVSYAQREGAWPPAEGEAADGAQGPSGADALDRDGWGSPLAGARTGERRDGQA
jgi:hypothetical protein